MSSFKRLSNALPLAEDVRLSRSLRTAAALFGRPVVVVVVVSLIESGRLPSFLS